MPIRFSGLLLLVSLTGIAQKPAAHQEVLDGFAYFQNGDNVHAIAHYDKAIRLDPTYADAYYYRGSAYWKHGDLDLALADLNKAIRMNGNDPDYFGERGNVYAEKKDF
ncbi:MAG: tetratricopeptide repeat protein, partial [Bacteroidota bacterium]|nr:tetratricopeptide repeat protein [Bacteroidota bacterium]